MAGGYNRVTVGFDRQSQGALDRIASELTKLGNTLGKPQPTVTPEVGDLIPTDQMRRSVEDMLGVCIDTNCHTEETLFKVVEAIEELGFKDDQAKQIINALQNKGILFRERLDGDLDG